MTDQGSGLLWESQPWAFSNSDNSGGGGGDEKSGEKLPDSSTSNSQTPSGNEPVAVAEGGEKRSSGDQGKKNGKGIMMEGKGGGESSDHEVHIWTERERRKKMRTMFSNLHALLPQLPPKADKSTIVDEAVTYIKTLETTLKKLQTQKLQRLRGVATMNYDLSSLITPPKPAMDTREAFIADQVSSNINNMQAMISTATNCSSSSLSVPGFPPIFQSCIANNVILNVGGLDAQFCVFAPKKPGLLTAITYVLEKYRLEVISASVWSDNYKSMYTIQTHACREGLIEAFPAEAVYKMAARDIDFFINSE